MMANRMKDALESIARRDVPENTDLWPRIVGRLAERKSAMKIIRTRPLTAVLIALLVLLILSGVAYALGRSLGYIPGLGLVSQDTPIRVLAAPVSQTRDGISITVKDAVLSSDKTVILFTVENIPLDKLSHREDIVACLLSAGLRLSDGTLVGSGAGGTQSWGTGYEQRFIYAPVPANVNDATLIIPCIHDAPPGVLPENWELSLHFVPAPPELTVMPVIEITPSPAPDSGTGVSAQNPLSITKVIDTGDSYIIIGEFQPPAPSQAGDWSSGIVNLKITDANGQEIFYDFPQDIILPRPGSKADVWAVEFNKGFVSPLHITYSNQYVFPPPPPETVEFEFDAGPNPQEDQVWELNKEIQMAGHTFTLASITALREGYSFNFMFSDGTISVGQVDIAGYTPIDGGGGEDSGGSSSQSISWSAALMYAELPKGKLKVILSSPWINGETKDWTIDWQPEGPPSGNLPPPTEAPQACLTLDKWNQPANRNDPLPVGVEGKVLTTVNEGGLSAAIYLSSLDGTNLRKLNTGGWPSLSADGARLAYTAADGLLHIVNLSTGQNSALGTDGYRPIWSPDSARMMYTSTTTFDLYVVNADGSGLQKVDIGPAQIVSPVGWLSDNQTVIYGTLDREGEGFDLMTYNLQNGETKALFTIHKNKAGYGAAVSSDGQWIVFADRLGTTNWSIFVSRIDGSERKLLAEPEVPAFDPVWSPAGQWLILNTQNAELKQIPVLVNPFSCQVVHLNNINGMIEGWIP